MRAREPDETGYAITGDGLRLYWERHGDGPTSIVLLPANPISHSRLWKAQVPYLARHYRVIVYDGRGNGKSDSPDPSQTWSGAQWASDCLTVMDASCTETAVLVGLCVDGVWPAVQIAVAQPERVQALVALAPGVPLTPPHAAQARALETFEEQLSNTEGWAKYNRHYVQRDYAGFLDFFFDQLLPEPHSTKEHEDAVRYGLDGSCEAWLLKRYSTPVAATQHEVEEICRNVRCPVLILHGDQDNCQPIARSHRLAELTGGRLVVLNGSGHLPVARHPVLVNTLIKEFVDMHTPNSQQSAWLFARERKRRVLWISSPIGLGHILRDIAISRAFRELMPDVEIHWWAQPPVTTVLEAEGEIVHPASTEMASESAHWESESAHHDLHAFYAFRRMDEIFCANYMLFDDVVRETPYDLWVGDESWDVDHFLHENPERKIAPYAFMTDVIGFLPVNPDGDPREAVLCADYNAEMIEHLDRFPYVRDRSLFIGSFDELPDASFGPGLPDIRDWSSKWFDSVPYVVPFEPDEYRRPAALRRKLGYGTGYPLYVAAVGGTAVGRDLLARIAEGFELVRRDEPTARMVMVTGPRINPDELPDVEGMDKLGYVPALFEHLACADVAIVQGGLSTTMELVAARRPFIYFPLAHHWEQQHFVAHRLDHYGAGIRMDYATTSPPDLAAAIRAARQSQPAYRPIRRGGAAQAAARLASLLIR